MINIIKTTVERCGRKAKCDDYDDSNHDDDDDRNCSGSWKPESSRRLWWRGMLSKYEKGTGNLEWGEMGRD
jgi:hypothetical protein